MTLGCHLLSLVPVHARFSGGSFLPPCRPGRAGRVPARVCHVPRGRCPWLGREARVWCVSHPVAVSWPPPLPLPISRFLFLCCPHRTLPFEGWIFCTRQSCPASSPPFVCPNLQFRCLVLSACRRHPAGDSSLLKVGGDGSSRGRCRLVLQLETPAFTPKVATLPDPGYAASLAGVPGAEMPHRPSSSLHRAHTS